MLPVIRYVALAAAWFVLAATALAQPVGVRDGAGLFQPQTLRKADEQVRDIRERYQTDLLIETVAALTPEQSAEFKKLRDAAARNRFFTDLAAGKAREAGAAGVYVIVWKAPRRAEVVVGTEVSEEVLTARERERVRDLLSSRRFERNPDTDLLRAITAVQESLEAPIRAAIWPWVLGLILGILAVWFALAYLRRDQPAGPGAAPAGSGVSPSVLGGGLGSAGGPLLSRSLFGPRKESPADAPRPPAENSGDVRPVAEEESTVESDER